MSRIIVAYNPVKKISSETMNQFSIAEKFFQNQTLQTTKINRYILLNGNAFISIVFKEDQENQIFVDSETRLAVFLDGYPLIGSKVMRAEDFAKEYLKVGPKQIAKSIDGSWSAVITDPKNNSILIFRDRFGRVPFYFSNNTDCFMASSSSGSRPS